MSNSKIEINDSILLSLEVLNKLKERDNLCFYVLQW